ncbi:type III PLP-dependent enzyme [Salimicrobium halophilum]|uniref:Diaminopimelate decarboxylase n=1 Tax=Salimicrobium halophilum TaxID=86666 RepID=A0A1G8TAU7_9BACI|nr:type III PLP-dependent enzyme [Salimicrobium halophilum]SDJ38035.1 diaminopimelate decarboxylase [Salimicrobium halophilum]
MNAIREYIDQTESPCAYVYDLNRLWQRAMEMQERLPDHCRLYYAVKANPDARILETLRGVVDGFEVASAGEMDKTGQAARIFGGPAKKEEELHRALEERDMMLNVESFHELRRLAMLAEEKQMTAGVLLRVNLEENVSDSHLKMAGVPTQFGVEEKRIPDLIEEALGHEFIEIRGFHFHAMSNNLDAKVHVAFAETAVKKSLQWKEDYQLDTSIIDLGGGFGINYWNTDEPFDWDGFAQGISDIDTKGHELILEAGRYMTAECGYYITEVLDVKENHGRHFAVVRGGSHHLRLPAAWKMSHPFHVEQREAWPYPFERPEAKGTEVVIAGELCTPNDLLVRGKYVESLRAGDVVVFTHAGAYAWTISHHDFLSHPHPEHVYIS